MKTLKTFVYLLLTLLIPLIHAQSAMQHPMGRDSQSLNGKWAVLPDIMQMGINSGWGNPTPPTDKLKLKELHYDGGKCLDVPGDWNSQDPEFVYFEAPMWYKKSFYHESDKNKRFFLHFAAVANNARVYMNGKELGSHRGGFTPFQFEVTDLIKDGENIVVVRVDNIRNSDSVPALSFDWWNYGGITRDVSIIATPKTYIKDYWLRLEKGSMDTILIDVELDGDQVKDEKVELSIEGTNYTKTLTTNAEGKASLSFKADLKLWSPESPTLYTIHLKSKGDAISDRIGFRCFEVRGPKIFLNNSPVFLRGINIHEEIARDRRRSINQDDAEYLTDQALALGCNFIRLSHYPHNEYMVRLCDKKGLMLWEEIPVWQNIKFSSASVCKLIENMQAEVIERDKNRCAIVIWSVANETFPSSPNRTEFLSSLIEQCKQRDNTRAIASALNGFHYSGNDAKDLSLNDPLAKHLDIVGINKYMSWYTKWRNSPTETKWLSEVSDKPFIISEFGAEAIYANYGDGENLNSWSEDYMAAAYEQNLIAFETLPNLQGTAPWILFDFRSPRRAHAMYQQGWNRKGLLSPTGDKKRAWYIMKDYYNTKAQQYKVK